MLWSSLPTCQRGCSRIGLTRQQTKPEAKRRDNSVTFCAFACYSASDQQLNHVKMISSRLCLADSVSERRPQGRSTTSMTARAGLTQGDASFPGPVQRRKTKNSLEWGFHAFGPLETDAEPETALLLITGLVCKVSAALSRKQSWLVPCW